MNAVALFAHLKSLGVKLSLENDSQLRIQSKKKGVLTPELRAALKQQKREIIRLLVTADRITDTTGHPIPVRSNKAETPLSFAQERLWFVERMAPGKATYHINRAYRLAGPIDQTALEAALRAVITRHQSLRTAFLEENGQPRAHVLEAFNWSLIHADLKQLTPAARERDAKELLSRFALKPFDLGKAPLFRALLIRLTENDHYLVLNMHHIVSDGWSQGVLTHEWTSQYNILTAPERDNRSRLPELPVQYADFAAWQRARLSGEARRKQLDYWKKQLSGIGTVAFPLDRPRPEKQTYAGANLFLRFPASLTSATRMFAQKRGTSVFMVLLASFQTLLYRYTGQTDIVVGCGLGNRNLPEIENLIGLFVNLLAIRSDLRGNPSFAELLDRVSETTLDAYENQDAPFEEVVASVNAVRGLDRHPLFQIQLVYANMPQVQPVLNGLEIKPFDQTGTVSRMDMTLFLFEEDRNITGYVEYNTDLFDRDAIERLSGHWTHLLTAATAAPETRLSALPLLTENEKQPLADLNRTTTDYPRDKLLHHIFEEIVLKHPDETALVHDSKRLSYRALNEYAERLAGHRRLRAIPRGGPVGLCLEPGFQPIIAILAILKAGGVYAPLDREYPKHRLSFMIEDAGLSLLITQNSLRELFPEALERILFDGLDDLPEVGASLALAFQDPNELAYIMYTSGSTGTPKGVAITHRNVVRLVKNTNYAAIGAHDVFLQASSISFDASTFEIWGSLLNGARLALMPSRGLDVLPDLLRRHGVTVLWLTGQLFHHLVDRNPEALAGVRQLLAGGEALSREHVLKFLKMFPKNRLINGYGPTENTTFTCCCDLSRHGVTAFSTPIGKPIANTRVHVLDDALQPAPLGVTGELFAAGDGLARCYLNRPRLTAERFIPDPFSPNPGGRLYRTGDLVRRRTGSHGPILEFQGRADRQVKLRGFRIELGEIEACLKGAPSIRDALVLLNRDDNGEARLIGYIQPESDETQGARPRLGQAEQQVPEDLQRELRRRLRERLPDYMIPAVLIQLDAFPLSPNGKLDLKALPDPDHVSMAYQTEFTPPRTRLETVIAEIWSELLKMPRIGIQDNFFDLGGHSLMMTRIISRLRQSLQINLSMEALFKYPTISELAQYIEIAGGASVEPEVQTTSDFKEELL